MEQSGVLTPLKELLGSGLAIPLASIVPSSLVLSSPRVPSPPRTTIIGSQLLTSPLDIKSISLSSVEEKATALLSKLENARSSSSSPIALATTLSNPNSPPDTTRMNQNGSSMVPSQLSAFPLFGGTGLPQPQSKTQEIAEEDLEAWQPFFAPAVPPSPSSLALAQASLLHSPLTGNMLPPSHLLSPRRLSEHMLDTISMDMGRTTLIPRLNLEALQMHPGSALFAPSSFAIPFSPSNSASGSQSGRISRLTTPTGSVSSAGGRGLPSASASSAGGSPPRGQRVKSTSSARDHFMDDLLPSPSTSARGKRRRSIYEEDSDLEMEGDEFLGTYIPAVTSARQKKKRALGQNKLSGSSE